MPSKYSKVPYIIILIALASCQPDITPVDETFDRVMQGFAVRNEYQMQSALFITLKSVAARINLLNPGTQIAVFRQYTSNFANVPGEGRIDILIVAFNQRGHPFQQIIIELKCFQPTMIAFDQAHDYLGYREPNERQQLLTYYVGISFSQGHYRSLPINVPFGRVWILINNQLNLILRATGRQFNLDDAMGLIWDQDHAHAQ